MVMQFYFMNGFPIISITVELYKVSENQLVDRIAEQREECFKGSFLLTEDMDVEIKNMTNAHTV